MIRVRKEDEPEDLASAGYSADSVKRQLLADQDSKCYLCERELVTDYEVEHRQSQQGHPELTNVWSNLFLSCSYCNGRKSNDFDGILDPANVNVELLIAQRYDAKCETFIFEPVSPENASAALTAKLLGRLFNGLRPRMLNLKEERFRAEFTQAYNLFMTRINDYLENPTVETKSALQAELKVTAEYLGFKYWLIMDDPALRMVFAPLMTWNRVE